MIEQWRRDWATAPAPAALATAGAIRGDDAGAPTPFIFAQIAPWPAQDFQRIPGWEGILTGIRYAQTAVHFTTGVPFSLAIVCALLRSFAERHARHVVIDESADCHV